MNQAQIVKYRKIRLTSPRRHYPLPAQTKIHITKDRFR